MASTIGYEEGKHNTIMSICDHVIFKKGLSSGWDQWFLEMALWDLRELKLDVFQDVKTVLLEVTDRKTVILPNNYVDWVVAAVKVGQYFVTLGVNNKLNALERVPNSTDYVNGLLSQNLPNGLDFNNYSGYALFNYGGSTSPSVGTGFITKGSFRYRNSGVVKELLLDYDYPHTHLYLEYISDGFDPCGETLVDPYFSDYLKKCVEFEWEVEKEPNRNEASIRRRGIAKADAEAKVRGRLNDLDPQTILNISRANTRFTPKI